MTRILIVRLSAIGDVLHGLPVLNAIRDALPDAEISWVVEGRTGDLLRGHPALTHLVNVPRGWLKSPREVLSLRGKLRALRPEIAIDLQGLTKSAVAAWLSGAKRRIGFGGVDGRELSPWLNRERVLPTKAHVIDRNLELLAPLGIWPKEIKFALPESAADGATADQIVKSHGCASGFAVINPGAGWPSKLWPPDRFGQVARHLGQVRSFPSLVVWAGAQEKAWAETIVANSAGHARLAPSTSLTELAALTRRATLFVGSDTGPLHLAVAVGTPCVGLFGPMPAERNGPYGPEHVAVQEVCLQGTSRERRAADGTSMAAISAVRVCAACDELLSRGTKSRRCA